jgi:hypothetical protein
VIRRRRRQSLDYWIGMAIFSLRGAESPINACKGCIGLIVALSKALSQ